MKPFRPAKPAPFWFNYGKTLSQTVIFWGLFLIALPAACLKIERWLGLPTFSPQLLLGVILFVVAGGLGLTSGFFMTLYGQGTPLPPDCPREIVVRGPYAFVRNPMAVAGICQGVAVGVALGSWLVIVYSLCGIPGWHFLARPSEEVDLRLRFGNEYEKYEREVPLWIPRKTRYRTSVENKSAEKNATTLAAEQRDS